MAKIGQRDKTWQALMQINPVQLKEVVHNAELRQAMPILVVPMAILKQGMNHRKFW